MLQLRVELHACNASDLASVSRGSTKEVAGKRTVDWLRLVGNTGELGVLGACDNDKSLGQLDKLVEVAHVG